MYTSPVSTTTLIKKATFTNFSAVTVTITAYLIPAAGSASTTNIILSVIPIAANNTYEGYPMENAVLATGDFVQCLCSAAASVSFTMSGIQILNS